MFDVFQTQKVETNCKSKEVAWGNWLQASCGLGKAFDSNKKQGRPRPPYMYTKIFQFQKLPRVEGLGSILLDTYTTF